MFLIKTDNQIQERPNSGKLYLRATVLQAPEGFEQLVGSRVRFNETDSSVVLAKTGKYIESDFEIGPRDESDLGHVTFQAFNGTVVRELPETEAAPLRIAERKAQLQQALTVDSRKWVSNPDRNRPKLEDMADAAAAVQAAAEIL